MKGQRQFSEQERAAIEDGIERVFSFVQDVVDEPSVLDELPERATTALTPLAEKIASESYATETHNFAVSVDLSGSAHRRTNSA
jgi:hypothetical protein